MPGPGGSAGPPSRTLAAENGLSIIDVATRTPRLRYPRVPGTITMARARASQVARLDTPRRRRRRHARMRNRFREPGRARAHARALGAPGRVRAGHPALSRRAPQRDAPPRCAAGAGPRARAPRGVVPGAVSCHVRPRVPTRRTSRRLYAHLCMYVTLKHTRTPRPATRLSPLPNAGS